MAGFQECSSAPCVEHVFCLRACLVGTDDLEQACSMSGFQCLLLVSHSRAAGSATGQGAWEVPMAGLSGPLKGSFGQDSWSHSVATLHSGCLFGSPETFLTRGPELIQ